MDDIDLQRLDLPRDSKNPQGQMSEKERETGRELGRKVERDKGRKGQSERERERE